MPVPPRDWSDPFLEQAREDLIAAWLLATSERSPSTLCMLLQMVFEKLGKATFARAGNVVPRSHQVASRLFLLLKRYPAGNLLLLASPQVEQFVRELENAHPAIVGNNSPPWPQLEYPWEDTESNTVMYPAKDLYLIRRITDPKDRIALDSLKFASALVQQLIAMVP